MINKDDYIECTAKEILDNFAKYGYTDFYLPLYVTDVVGGESYFLFNSKKITPEELGKKIKEYEDGNCECSFYDFLNRL